MTEYTPTDSDIRNAYRYWSNGTSPEVEQADEEFDHWMLCVKAGVWDECAEWYEDMIARPHERLNPYREFTV